jgi:hypothetical protein
MQPLKAAVLGKNAQVAENKEKNPCRNFCNYEIPLPLPSQILRGSSLIISSAVSWL